MTNDGRQQRGLMIAATARIRQQGGAWTVPSQSTRGRYTVALGDGGHCTCPDFEERQLPCKHIFAVEFVIKRETAPDGTVTEIRAARASRTRRTGPRTTRRRRQKRNTFAGCSVTSARTSRSCPSVAAVRVSRSPTCSFRPRSKSTARPAPAVA